MALRALLGAVVLVFAFPSSAFAAEPPQALPSVWEFDEGQFQPATDSDGDGCYPTPAIGPDGRVAEGLNNSGALNGNCRDIWDLDSTNSYSRKKCNNGWCAFMYAYYFEKDQVVAGLDAFGHRHDWEHILIWVKDGIPRYVSTSAHGGYSTHPRSEVAWEESHAKVVYHKDGGGTHAFRRAAFDETPENHYGKWQYPALVGWDYYPDGVRDILTQADFGEANFGLKDSAFSSELMKAKPGGIPFDPFS
ncbi:NPP1 family protein [Streptomyces sp. NPDC051776]|uniref:NPP1 family protein n=1 Tax=Streptomyces sp. NPDC051776 TaxID=3155414 RepID=UPI00343F00D4